MGNRFRKPMKSRQNLKEEILLDVLCPFPEKFWKIIPITTKIDKHGSIPAEIFEKLNRLIANVAGKGTFSGKFGFFSVKNERTKDMRRDRIKKRIKYI